MLCRKTRTSMRRPNCLVSGTTTNGAVMSVSVSGAHHGALLQTPAPMSVSATLLYCVCVVFISLYWSSRLNKFRWIKVLRHYDGFSLFKLHRGALWDWCRSEENNCWLIFIDRLSHSTANGIVNSVCVPDQWQCSDPHRAGSKHGVALKFSCLASKDSSRCYVINWV